jgi:hypothetical protein
VPRRRISEKYSLSAGTIALAMFESAAQRQKLPFMRPRISSSLDSNSLLYHLELSSPIEMDCSGIADLVSILRKTSALIGDGLHELAPSF